MEFSNETALLQAIYKGGAMGTLSIAQLLPKVQNPCFRTDLQTQLNEYQKVMKQAESQLKALSVCPKELPPWEKTMLTMSLQAQTLLNKETSHLAEMMIQGSNMGIVSLTKVLNCYRIPNEVENGPEGPKHMDAHQKARDLANNMIQAEKDNINRLKTYLG